MALRTLLRTAAARVGVATYSAAALRPVGASSAAAQSTAALSAAATYISGLRGFAAAADGDEERKRGTVKFFNTTKGWGFITPDDGSPDVFVHQTTVHSPGFRSLADGEPVEFSVSESNGKVSAVNVTGPNGDFVQGSSFYDRQEPRGHDDMY